MKKLVWNVFRRGMNSNKIEEYNVFEHGSFYKDMVLCLRDCRDKDEFKTELRRDLMYYFWSKVEHETFITEPFPRISEEELARLNNEKSIYRHMPRLSCGEKIDVYRQIEMNYSHFIDYIWRNRDEILADNQ